MHLKADYAMLAAMQLLLTIDRHRRVHEISEQDECVSLAEIVHELQIIITYRT